MIKARQSIELSSVSALLMLVAMNAAYAQNLTIEDFVAAQQQSVCVPEFEPVATCPTDGLFVPPASNYQGWSAPTGRNKICSGSEGEVCRFALVDYAGAADAFIREATQGGLDLGTTFEGSVKVDPASGGCAQVTVKLRTRNALTFVAELSRFDDFTGEDSIFATSPLLFGARVADVLQGAEPALADSVLHVRYLANADEPLPNLLQLINAPEGCEELEFLRFQADARSAEGTASVRQVGLFLPDNKVFSADAFPVERIDVR